MTPLQKCRKAKNISLQTLSAQLTHLSGSSVTTLSRIEAGSVKKIGKDLTDALVEVFEGTGLIADHILEPKRFPDFSVKCSAIPDKTHRQPSDATFNEQSILLSFSKKWFDTSNMTQTKFSETLYEKLSVDGLVALAPSDVSEYAKWQNTASKRVSRILEGEQPLPLAWKHYWLACLPENIKQLALSQMMANTGYMLVPLPKTPKIITKDSAAKIHDISREFSDVIARSKPAMDGVYDDRDDLGELQLLQDELAELIAACLRESTVIERSTGVTSKLQQIWAASPLNQ